MQVGMSSPDKKNLMWIIILIKLYLFIKDIYSVLKWILLFGVVGWRKMTPVLKCLKYERKKDEKSAVWTDGKRRKTKERDKFYPQNLAENQSICVI